MAGELTADPVRMNTWDAPAAEPLVVFRLLGRLPVDALDVALLARRTGLPPPRDGRFGRVRVITPGRRRHTPLQRHRSLSDAAQQ